MKKTHTVLCLFACAFFSLFWLPWIAPFTFLGGIAVLIWGVETGPDGWQWKWTIKKSED
jgi:hypothetical protein